MKVWCEGMDPENEDIPVNEFVMTLPEGITGGTTLEDIDGRGHFAIVPDGYEAGDEIILVMPAPERSGELPLPNRNCFFAYAPPFMGGMNSKRYYEGDVQEHDHEHLELLSQCAGCHAELLTTRGGIILAPFLLPPFFFSGGTFTTFVDLPFIGPPAY